jgi:hypothetical protein
MRLTLVTIRPASTRGEACRESISPLRLNLPEAYRWEFGGRRPTRSNRVRRRRPGENPSRSSASPTRYSEPVMTTKGSSLLAFNASPPDFQRQTSAAGFAARKRRQFARASAVRSLATGTVKIFAASGAKIRQMSGQFLSASAPKMSKPAGSGKIFFQRRAQRFRAGDVVRAVEQDFLAVRIFESIAAAPASSRFPARRGFFLPRREFVLQNFHRGQRQRGVEFLVFAQKQG